MLDTYLYLLIIWYITIFYLINIFYFISISFSMSKHFFLPSTSRHHVLFFIASHWIFLNNKRYNAVDWAQSAVDAKYAKKNDNLQIILQVSIRLTDTWPSIKKLNVLNHYRPSHQFISVYDTNYVYYILSSGIFVSVN